jgi:hypothetical protein
MNNSVIELEIIQRFGLDKTVSFCEMVSFMYELMHDDVKERGMAHEFDYDFDRDWWANKCQELKRITNETKRVAKIISSGNEQSKRVYHRED